MLYFLRFSICILFSDVNKDLIGPVFVHEVKHDSDLHNDVARKLINESQGIFLKLQHMAAAHITTEDRKLE